MNKNIKRLLALLLALVMVFGMLACGADMQYDDDDDDDDDKKSTEATDPNEEVDASGKVKIKVGLGSNVKVLDFEDNALTKWLEETCGVDIEIVEYAGGTDVATQISATIAARQELPDILWGVEMGEATIYTYGKEGYFANLRPYYEDDQGASKIFWDRITGYLSDYEQECVIQDISDPDTGLIYCVPTVQTSLVNDIDSMAWINTEWLDQVGGKAPTNMEELYDLLVKFKAAGCEFPLYGSQNTSSSAQVVNWIINMFIYYNDDHSWQDYNGDGQLESVYTLDEFREALQFANKLYKEKLLNTDVFTATSDEMKLVTTPVDGKARCGIFLGHLTTHTAFGNETLYQYEALEGWGCATEASISISQECFITETAVNRGITDKCFEILMTMWSWDGSMRVRYGEYGVNWTDADPGAKSDYGLDATYKLLDDPFTQQTAAQWGKVSGTFVHYAEGETAQISENLDRWTATKSAMHVKARLYFDKAAATINPTFLRDPYLKRSFMTTRDEDIISMKAANFNSVVTTYVKDFITGANKKDINSPVHWQEFLNELNKQGYEDVREMYQKYYERNK